MRKIFGAALALILWSATTAAQGAVDVAEVEQARLDEAVDLLKEGKPAEAVAKLEKVVAANDARHRGSNRDVYCARSPVETLLYMGMAATAKRSAVSVDGTYCDAIFLTGFALIDLGKPVEARKWIERAVAMAPNNAHYRNELAESYKTERKWDKAAALFEQAAGDARAFSPDDVKNSELARALRGSGFVRIETGQLVEAQKLFEECLRLDPGDANAQRELRYIADLRAKSAVN